MNTFRTATPDDLTQVLDWAATEGWNPGTEDAAAFFAADPKGFFVATDAQGELCAAISVVNHTDAFAFLGLYIVRPAYRRQGLGYALWQHALAHAGDRTVGLDGVEAQQANYLKSGFDYQGGTLRFTGGLTPEHSSDIALAEAGDLHRLIAMEAATSGVEKPAYLTAWFTQTPTRRTIALSQDGAIVGFCTVRACRDGAKIGPLVAETAADAQRLMAHAASLMDGPYTVDVPQAAKDLVALCQSLGFQTGFKTARMYRGPFNAVNLGVFAVATLELG